MPVNKEFTIRLEDRPGTLGKVCQALADQNVNILAFQQLPLEKGKGAVRLVLDNPAAAKTTLDQQRADYTETEVAQINLSHRTGELARAASRLGEAGININYGYCGAEPGTNATFVIFGVAEVGKAVKVFEQEPPEQDTHIRSRRSGRNSRQQTRITTYRPLGDADSASNKHPGSPRR